MSKKPIGIFDSGYGGLTVLKEIRKVLPEYDYIYLGDNARTPYGNRSFDVVYQYTLQAVKKLFSMDCELVILACNTASAKALRSIQQNDLEELGVNKRVLGVIRPSTEIIGDITKTGHVGVLGTEGTVKSNSYQIEINKFFPTVSVVQEACPVWVPIIENGLHETEGGEFFIKHHLDKLMTQDSAIDTVILGCTHYPILQKYIEDILGDEITVLSQGEIVASSLKDYLNRHPEMDAQLSKGGSISYHTSENPSDFSDRAGVFLNESIEAKHLDIS